MGTWSSLEQYLVRLAPEERHARIRAALSQAGSATHFVRTRLGYLELPMVHVAHDVLVYRIDNGRILSELAADAHANNTTVVDLKAHGDEIGVQKTLHALLILKARDPNASIFLELQAHRQQTEPLLITREGLVIDGNRRLAAMRELLMEDGDRYAGFTTVAAAVLPAHLTREEIDYIEANLQMAPDLKLDYGWINRRLKLREHLRDLDRKVIVEAYRLSDVEQVDVELKQLELAERYLEYLGEPDAYARLAEDEKYLVCFGKQLTALHNTTLQRLWTLAGFAMLAARGDLKGSILHCFPFADPTSGDLANWVMHSFAEEMGLTKRRPGGDNPPVDAELASALEPVLAAVANAPKVARLIIGLVETLRASEETLLGPFRVLSHIRAARDHLAALRSGNVTAQQLRQIRAELAAFTFLLDAIEPAEGRPALASQSAAGFAATQEAHPNTAPLPAPREPLDLLNLVHLEAHARRQDGAIHVDAGRAGNAFYGPYLRLASGLYRANVTILADNPHGLSALLAAGKATLEVAFNQSVILARKELSFSHLGGRRREITLTFALTPEQAGTMTSGVELRLYSDGKLPLTIDRCDVECLPQARWAS